MAKKKTSPDDILSTAQAAEELGLSINRVNVLLNSGRIPASKLGWAWMIRRGDLEAVRNRPTGRPRKKSDEKLKKRS
jgi:excisionase family DNA binding protein